MQAEDFVAALGLPAEAVVARRVPKSLLVEHGGVTSADRRAITDGVESITWAASLKSGNCGIPTYWDAEREYLEIAVVLLAVRDGARRPRLTELVHRAIPYPVLLVASQGGATEVSVAHKRRSLASENRMVLDGEPEVAELPTVSSSVGGAFLEACALSARPRPHFCALYDGWRDALTALRAAAITGTFVVPSDDAASPARREALSRLAALDVEMSRVHAAADRERQTARLVQLNLDLARLRTERAVLLERL